MKLCAIRMLLALPLAAVFLVAPLRAEVFERAKKVGDTTVHFKLVLPDGYDAAKTYPAILGFGGGPQNMNTVDGIINRNFRAARRHALAAVRFSPLSYDSWSLMYHAVAER